MSYSPKGHTGDGVKYHEGVKIPSFKDDFFSELYLQRKANTLCDVTVIVGGERFPAHKLVLGLVSSYFKTMFTSNFVEATSSEVTIAGSPDTFRRLLNFAYSGNLLLIPEVVADVARMSCYLQMPHALQACNTGLKRFCRYWEIDTEAGTEVIFQAFAVAHNYGLELEPMANEAHDFLTVNFAKFSQTEAYLRDVMPDILEQFLVRNDLTALSDEMSEEKVLEAVTKWLKYDWKNRKDFAERLLRKVRLGVIPKSKVATYLTEEMKVEPGCRELLARILGNQSSQQQETSAAEYGNQEMFARRGVTVLMSIQPDNSSHSVAYYNTNTHKWAQGYPSIPAGTKTQNNHLPGESDAVSRDLPISMNSINGQLYVGMRRNKTFKNFVRFNEKTRRWNQLPHMKKPFTGCSVAHLDNYLYVVGGWSTDKSACEILHGCELRGFNLDTQMWEDLPPIPTPQETSSLPSITISFLDKLFVYAATAVDTRGLFMYDPVTKCWKSLQLNVSELYEPRFFIHDGKLFRVLYNKDKDGLDESYKPSIHQLQYDVNSNEPSVVLGEKQCHQSTPSKQRLFHMQHSLFVDLNGYIYKLQTKSEPGTGQLKKWNAINGVLHKEGERGKVPPVFGMHTFEKIKLNMGLPRK